MAWTYDLATDTGKVRLELGDSTEAGALLSDEEIAVFLEREGSVLGAAAAACDALARRFARDVDFTQDDSSYKLGSRSEHYANLAKELRDRAGGIVTKRTKRVDGYSDDYGNRDEAGTLNAAGRDAWWVGHGRGT